MISTCAGCGERVRLVRWTARGVKRWSIPGVEVFLHAVCCHETKSGLHEPMGSIDAEWRDICDGNRLSGIVTQDGWVGQGRKEPRML